MNSSEYYGEEITPDNISPFWDKQVAVVIGWFWWDESKWTQAELLAKNIDYELLISPVGWPNAWHTITMENGKKFIWSNLPWSVITWKDVFLGQWKYINTEWLKQELLQLKELWIESKIKIAQSAHSLYPLFHGRLDGSIEEAKKENGNNIGTTKSGMWPWVATRWLRNSITMWKLQMLWWDDLKVAVKELMEPFNPNFIPDEDQIITEIKKHQSILNLLIDEGVAEIVDDMYAQQGYHAWWKSLIEWAQSDPLGMYGWAYPSNTSTDTSFWWIFSSLWIVPTLDRVELNWVLKIISSKVGIHEFLERISNMYPGLLDKEIELARKTWEFWSISGRMRELWFFDMVRLANDIKNNPFITSIAIRKFDVLSDVRRILWLKELPVVTDYDSTGKPILTNLPFDDQIIIETMRNIIDEETWTNRWRDMTFIGWYGPKASDSRIIRPGM